MMENQNLCLSGEKQRLYNTYVKEEQKERDLRLWIRIEGGHTEIGLLLGKEALNDFNPSSQPAMRKAELFSK